MLTLDHFLALTGWIALALNIWGNFEIANKTIRGWIIRIACNAFYAPYCIYTGAWALLANHAIFAGINVYGWWKWTRDARAPVAQPAAQTLTFLNPDVD